MKPSRLALAALLLCAAPLSHAADADPKVLSAAENYRGDALQLLERLVNIDSGTGNEAGLSQVGSIVADELRKTGAQVQTVSAAPAVGNNILATWKGTGKTRILLMAHMDTVFKDGTARAKPFYFKDKRAYGPGVMDDKGGVVAGLYAMKILQQLDFKRFSSDEQLALFVAERDLLHELSPGIPVTTNFMVTEHIRALDYHRWAREVAEYRPYPADDPTIMQGNRIVSNTITQFLQTVWDGGAIYTTGFQGTSAANGTESKSA